VKKKKISIADKALTNAVKKGEISLSNLPKSKRNIVKSIAKTTSDDDLEKASKNKYKFSRRKVKHISKNESLDKDDFKRIITNLEDWDDAIKGGKAKDKKPSDFDLDDLSAGAEIQTEHTDEPEIAIDIAMDHLEEDDDYYDEETGLPDFERRLKRHESDEDNEEELDEEITSDDEYFDDDEKINDITMEKKFIKKFSNFSKINESDEPSEPKMYPKENKFKRIIEYNDDIEESLVSHNFNKKGGEGEFVVFDLMDKSYQLVGDMSDDIRPCEPDEFDHMMNNL